MKENPLKTPIEYLKGVGPKRAELLQKELQVFRFEDLLYYYPFRYIDKSKVLKIAEISDDLAHVQIFGKLIALKKVGAGRQTRVHGILEDDSGTIELVWFKGVKWITQNLKEGAHYLVFGRPRKFKSSYNIAHPEMEEKSSAEASAGPPLYPVYPSTEKLSNNGLGTRVIGKLVHRILEETNSLIPETLSTSILNELKLPNKRQALIHIHFPKDKDSLAKAIFRLKFEELFFIQLRLLKQKQVNLEKFRGFVFEKIGPKFNEFYEKVLPFPLTEAQKRVLKEIRKNLNTGKQMNRLLQGDVGSGKTIVAAMTVLMAIDNGFQSCMMAPTEILAQQHFQGLSELLGKLGIEVRLLTGSTSTKERNEILQELESGRCKLIIGTHALLEDRVVFQNLGLIVIDEQHRFGVAQRAKMWRKNTNPPHVLVMTATPIPRTLAMTLYGDLDVSVIDELPPGRKPIQTLHARDSSRLKIFGFIEKEIAKGRQVYIVYPLIEESSKMDYKDLMDGFESISRRFPKPQYQISIVHGKMKPADKAFEMERFVSGQTQIMIATTVIEVGVDVPNASIMVIESAERFGLSQLHQLRGRVGRGAEQSYCILMTGHKLSAESKIRMETMVRSNDGFEIAEVDLQLRGPGDFHGTQQSGLPLELKLTNLSKDGQILATARNIAADLLNRDPDLQAAENEPIATTFKRLHAKRISWSRIS